jgi:DNA polymerase III delta prime subunit
MSKTLIDKYKPYYIDDFKLEDDTHNVLKTLLELDCLNVLLTGTSNSGKTTMLHALIREYYGLTKDDKTESNTNVLFINNLKEQGIQYYRNDMKTFCQSSSSIYGKKKLVLIDDIDTINEQSQQVFRNYIDKYKHNINFISVCTNNQKVIESIQSRLHIIKLKPPSNTHLKNILNIIVNVEGIVIDECSKDYLLDISNGSLRTIINYLEKLYLYQETVDIDLCKKVCTNVTQKKYEEYFECIKKDNCSEGINILYSIYDQGYSVIDILDSLFINVKNSGNLEEEIKYRMIKYICKYITAFHIIHEHMLELCFITNNLCEIVKQ